MAFTCILISTSIETLLWCWTMLVIFVAVESDGFCHLKCYHIEVLLHFLAGKFLICWIDVACADPESFSEGGGGPKDIRKGLKNISTNFKKFEFYRGKRTLWMRICHARISFWINSNSKVNDNKPHAIISRSAHLCVLIMKVKSRVCWHQCQLTLPLYNYVQSWILRNAVFWCIYIDVYSLWISAGCSGVGVTIFAYKYDRYVWYWIFAVAGGACAGANSFLGCCCQNIKRKVKSRFVDLELGEEMALPMKTKLHKRWPGYRAGHLPFLWNDISMTIII